MKHLVAISSIMMRRATLRRLLLPAAALAIVGASAAAASYSGKGVSAAQQPPAAQVISQQSFEATGLPAGAATGEAMRVMLPAGWNLKHVHGGNEYVYVLSGSLTVTMGDSSKTYNAGDFAWVPGGVVHTGASAQGAEVFVLSIRPTGSEWLIPAL